MSSNNIGQSTHLRIGEGIGTLSTDDDADVEAATKIFYANDKKLRTMMRTVLRLKAGSRSWIMSNKEVSEKLTKIFTPSLDENVLTNITDSVDNNATTPSVSIDLVSSQRMYTTTCEAEAISIPSIDAILASHVLEPIDFLLTTEYAAISKSIKERKALLTDLGAHTYSFEKTNKKILDNNGKVKEVEYLNLEVFIYLVGYIM